MSLSLSTIVEICGICSSFLTSIIAIVISVKTLRQNSRMIEESTRPYITIYLGDTYFSSTTVYLIIKNFGSSSAEVTQFDCDFDLSRVAYDKEIVPFSHIIGTSLCPNESIKFPINVKCFKNDVELVRINMSYHSSEKDYRETVELNFAAHFDVLHLRANTEDQHLKEISFALQDISEKML